MVSVWWCAYSGVLCVSIVMYGGVSMVVNGGVSMVVYGGVSMWCKYGGVSMVV